MAPVPQLKFDRRDPTVLAVPAYFASMALEAATLRRRRSRGSPARAGDYEARDTKASLLMGVLSLVVPILAPRLLRPFTPGPGRFGRGVVAAAGAAAVVATISDLGVKRAVGTRTSVCNGATGRGAVPSSTIARKVAGTAGVAAVGLGGLAAATAWSWRTAPGRLFERRVLPDLGNGPLALLAATVGWDFVYYWNHRLMHESRYMWAIHVVHHSSERYNLSTALRQPVLEPLGTFAPYGVLCLFGVNPELLTTARGINLLYQYWIHTEAIETIGGSESILNSPSHHRVHHGSNPEYLDRNHGSILIVWDRLFGTFEPERERVVYGLTKNLGTFNPFVIIGHEYAEIVRDVASATNWSDRIGYVVRGPGWARVRRAELSASRAAAHNEVSAG
jgi:sterol desaturase/sphingolipid hydroxylase (fatty acid hydroxylase superfamily)